MDRKERREREEGGRRRCVRRRKRHDGVRRSGPAGMVGDNKGQRSKEEKNRQGVSLRKKERRVRELQKCLGS